MAKKITKWEDCGRNDLNMIPTMISRGFSLVYTESDRRYNRTTIMSIPHDPVTFKRHTLTVTRNLRKKKDGLLYYGWQTVSPGVSFWYNTLQEMLDDINE